MGECFALIIIMINIFNDLMYRRQSNLIQNSFIYLLVTNQQKYAAKFIFRFINILICNYKQQYYNTLNYKQITRTYINKYTIISNDHRHYSIIYFADSSSRSRPVYHHHHESLNIGLVMLQALYGHHASAEENKANFIGKQVELFLKCCLFLLCLY